MYIVEELCNYNLVIGLPKHKYDKDQFCGACVKGKQVKASFKP